MLVIWTDCSFVAGARCRDACNLDGLRQGGGKHWHGGNSILGGDVQNKQLFLNFYAFMDASITIIFIH